MKMDKDLMSAALEMMGNSGGICPPEECDKSCEGRSRLGQVIERMGGTAFVMGASETVLRNAVKFFPDNKRYQFAVKTARGAIPAFMMGRQLLHAVAGVYRDNRKRPETPHQAKRRRIGEELDIDDDVLGYHRMNFGSHIGDWLSSMPDNDTFKTLEVKTDGLEKEGPKKVTEIKDDNLYLMTAEIGGKKMIVEIRKITTRYTEMTDYDIEVWRKWTDDPMDIRLAIVSSFISDFNIKENTIHCTTLKLEAKKRQKVAFPVYQCRSDFVTEVKRALKMKERRTYALVGEAGCGKTTSLLAIIDKFRHVPVITTTCKTISNVIGAYLTAQAAAPCLVVLEDIDQMELSEKSSKDLGLLIGLLDSSYDMSQKIVTIMTLNEPQNVHPCLMSRRGRIDRVMHFGPPKTVKEVAEVMNNCSKEVFGKRARWVSSPKNIDMLDKIIKSELTHADIRELVNWCKLNSDAGRTSVADVQRAFDTLMDSIRNVNRFIHREKDKPVEVDEEEEEPASIPMTREDLALKDVEDRILAQGDMDNN